MKKILIVDDEKITLRMAQHILAKQYETICVSSGAEAIEVYKKERPDMILTNFNLPKMSGFELQNTIQDQYAQYIPVMYMTKDENDETAGKGFELGAVDFIRKPFRADVLLRRVENILSNVENNQGSHSAAENDPMTGLLNRSSSQQVIGNMCRDINGVLLVMDLNNFSEVNERYGHNVGDKILIRLAEIIRSAIRSNDIAGRMGADKFIAFFQSLMDEGSISEKIEYINGELIKSAREFIGEDVDISLGVSAGGVLAPKEGTDFLTLYQKAEKALDDVKQKGKGGFSLFAAGAGDKKNEIGEATDIEQEMERLGESDKGKGAFQVDADQFKTIYRFLARMEVNYQKGNKFIIFNVIQKNDKKATVPEEIIDKFYEILCKSLRGSDVVTYGGKNQIKLLLLEAENIYSEIVVKRIIDNWKEFDTEGKYVITCETEVVR